MLAQAPTIVERMVTARLDATHLRVHSGPVTRTWVTTASANRYRQ